MPTHTYTYTPEERTSIHANLKEAMEKLSKLRANLLGTECAKNIPDLDYGIERLRQAARLL